MPLKKLPADALPANKSWRRSANSSPIDSDLRFPCSSNLLGNSTVSSESESWGGRSYLSLKSCEAGSLSLRPRRLDLRSWRRDEVTVSSESEYEWRSREPARRRSCGNSMLESRSKRTRLFERVRGGGGLTDFGLIRPSARNNTCQQTLSEDGNNNTRIGLIIVQAPTYPHHQVRRERLVERIRLGQSWAQQQKVGYCHSHFPGLCRGGFGFCSWSYSCSCCDPYWPRDLVGRARLQLQDSARRLRMCHLGKVRLE
jgi:hypothetical protein